MNISTHSSFFLPCLPIPDQPLAFNRLARSSVGNSRLCQWQPDDFYGATLFAIVQFVNDQNRVSITKQKISPVSEISIVWGAGYPHDFFSAAQKWRFALGSPPIKYTGLTGRPISLGVKNTHTIV
ncbi:hypothetical protein [Spirosoma endbachense]|uniref:Uncharacterized protein n=1 Tax=Spirosoma endbachense TaxID=2666025 RepID=A0A6P1VWH6_9BACT|nr:hypothetical protein [Spirosoma endbachense]QHV96039.1 hypothetical protein GJR95_13920 [Spirosoma endbachense]